MKILILFLSLVLSSCCKKTCYTGPMPYLNGIRGMTTEFNNANVKVHSAIVDSTKSTYTLSAKILCTNDGKNDPRNIEVIVLLPNEVNIIDFNGPSKCLVPSKTGLFPTDDRIHAGIIRFSKNSMKRDPQESFDISVTTSKVLKSNASSPNFSIFVYNQSPEINYKDNFWSWK